MEKKATLRRPVSGERPTVAGGLLRIEKIYHEPDVADYERGREVLACFPEAERVEVPSHWNIPELHGDEGGVGEWNRTKKTVLVLGAKKSLQIRPFYRSCDFVAPSRRTAARWPARIATSLAARATPIPSRPS